MKINDSFAVEKVTTVSVWKIVQLKALEYLFEFDGTITSTGDRYLCEEERLKREKRDMVNIVK